MCYFNLSSFTFTPAFTIYRNLTFCPTELSIASFHIFSSLKHPISLSLLLHPSPHPLLLPVLFYLCTESAFQSSVPQACRETDHGVNYTLPYPPPLLLYPTTLPLSLSLALCVSLSMYVCL